MISGDFLSFALSLETVTVKLVCKSFFVAVFVFFCERQQFYDYLTRQPDDKLHFRFLSVVFILLFQFVDLTLFCGD